MVSGCARSARLAGIGTLLGHGTAACDVAEAGNTAAPTAKVPETAVAALFLDIGIMGADEAEARGRRDCRSFILFLVLGWHSYRVQRDRGSGSASPGEVVGALLPGWGGSNVWLLSGVRGQIRRGNIERRADAALGWRDGPLASTGGGATRVSSFAFNILAPAHDPVGCDLGLQHNARGAKRTTARVGTAAGTCPGGQAGAAANTSHLARELGPGFPQVLVAFRGGTVLSKDFDDAFSVRGDDDVTALMLGALNVGRALVRLLGAYAWRDVGLGDV